MKSTPKHGRKDLVQKGLEPEVHCKICYCRGGTIFISNYFLGGGGGGVKCGQQQQQHQLYLHDYNYEVTVLQKL